MQYRIQDTRFVLPHQPRSSCNARSASHLWVQWKAQVLVQQGNMILFWEHEKCVRITSTKQSVSKHRQERCHVHCVCMHSETGASRPQAARRLTACPVSVFCFLGEINELGLVSSVWGIRVGGEVYTWESAPLASGLSTLSAMFCCFASRNAEACSARLGCSAPGCAGVTPWCTAVCCRRHVTV